MGSDPRIIGFIQSAAAPWMPLIHPVLQVWQTAFTFRMGSVAFLGRWITPRLLTRENVMLVIASTGRIQTGMMSSSDISLSPQKTHVLRSDGLGIDWRHDAETKTVPQGRDNPAN